MLQFLARLVLMERQTVRDRLRRLIEWSGTKQSDIARRLGQNESWVSRRLTGETGIQADEIDGFARALRVPPSTLVDDAELEALLRMDRIELRGEERREDRMAARWSDRLLASIDESEAELLYRLINRRR